MRRAETAVQSALLEQGRKGAWTAGAEAGQADAAKYAPGRVNRGLLITLGALALLVAIAVPVLLATAVLASILPGGGSSRPPDGGVGNGDAAAIQRMITAFCQSVHDANYSAAYAYFSPHLQQSVRSPSQVPTALGSIGTMDGCSEFSGGSFLTITVDTAQDPVIFTVATPSFGTQDAPGTMYFVKSGSDWLIDGISG
jgi:hypothetical protein